MKKHLIIYTALTVMSAIVFAPAFGQSTDDVSAQLQAALKADNAAAALEHADTLYALHKSSGDQKAAGNTAYMRGKILESSGKHEEAGKAFGDCDGHFDKLAAVAQSLDCRYLSALAYRNAGKTGNALDKLQSTRKGLEKIGQDKSDFAAGVYISLAKEVMPLKLDGDSNAIRGRKSSIKYANNAMTALSANGRENSAAYASALVLKAVAHEDGRDYDDAVGAYSDALSLYKTLPNIPTEALANVETRLANAQHFTKAGRKKQKENKNKLTVTNKAGDKVVLKIKKKKKVQFPRARIGNDQLVDGARVRANITLADNGRVADIEIIESIPSKNFGENFAKAVSTWTFTPEDGSPPADIPVFEYEMTYAVYRR